VAKQDLTPELFRVDLETAMRNVGNQDAC